MYQLLYFVAKSILFNICVLTDFGKHFSTAPATPQTYFECICGEKDEVHGAATQVVVDIMKSSRMPRVRISVILVFSYNFGPHQVLRDVYSIVVHSSNMCTVNSLL